MDRAKLLEELKSMISEYLKDDDRSRLETITDNTNFLNDLNMDSIDLVDVVIKVENQYGITIQNESIAGLNTVGKCLDMIQEKLAEKKKA